MKVTLQILLNFENGKYEIKIASIEGAKKVDQQKLASFLTKAVEDWKMGFVN